MQSRESGTVYAGFFVRFAAFMVDSLIMGAALLLVRIPIWFASFGTGNILTRDFIFKYSAVDIVLYLINLCYFVLLTYFTGATLGKKLFHLRVVSSEDRSPSFFEIVFRESVGRFLSGLIVWVGYIMIGADKKKRGLHDFLSDTHVVYEHKVSVAVPTPVLVRRVPYAVQQPIVPPVQNQPPQGQFMQGDAVQQPVVPPVQNQPPQSQFMQGDAVQQPVVPPAQNQPPQGQSVQEDAAQNQAEQQSSNAAGAEDTVQREDC